MDRRRERILFYPQGAHQVKADCIRNNRYGPLHQTSDQIFGFTEVSLRNF